MPRQGKYPTIQEAAKQGQYSLVEPFDYLILLRIPEEGTMLSNLYEIGETVQSIRKGMKLPKEITADNVTGRLKSMEVQGLTRKVRTFNASKRTWQATKLGKKVANEWKERTGWQST